MLLWWPAIRSRVDKCTARKADKQRAKIFCLSVELGDVAVCHVLHYQLCRWNAQTTVVQASSGCCHLVPFSHACCGSGLRCHRYCLALQMEHYLSMSWIIASELARTFDSLGHTENPKSLCGSCKQSLHLSFF